MIVIYDINRISIGFRMPDGTGEKISLTELIETGAPIDPESNEEVEFTKVYIDDEGYEIHLKESNDDY